MKANIEFIKQQFKSISDDYSLSWINLGEYGGYLKNQAIAITVFTDRIDSGMTLSLRNVRKSESYYFFDILLKHDFESYKDYLTGNELIVFDKLKDKNDKLVYAFRVFLERYCQKYLNEDFSELGEGRSY